MITLKSMVVVVTVSMVERSVLIEVIALLMIELFVVLVIAIMISLTVPNVLAFSTTSPQHLFNRISKSESRTAIWGT